VTAEGSEQVDQVKLILIEGIAVKIRARYESQREAARALNYPDGTISRLCNGSYQRFSIAFLIDFAHQVGASINIQVG